MSKGSKGWHPLKKKSLIFLLILIIGGSLGFPANCLGEGSTVVVEVFYWDKSQLHREHPVMTNGLAMVPLRTLLESIGVIVQFNPTEYAGKSHAITFSLVIGSKQVTLNRGRRLDSKVLVLEQAPFISNGRTVVPYKFVWEVAGATLNPEEDRKHIASIANTLIEDKSKLVEIKEGYKHYEIMIGDPVGPAFDQAEKYVLDHQLLSKVKLAGSTPPNGAYTMLLGMDDKGREKLVWLSLESYTKEISVSGSAYIDEGVGQDEICKKLQSQGIENSDIKTLAIVPYDQQKVCWFVEANKNNRKHFAYYDFYTGQVQQEWSFEDDSAK